MLPQPSFGSPHPLVCLHPSALVHCLQTPPLPCAQSMGWGQQWTSFQICGTLPKLFVSLSFLSCEMEVTNPTFQGCSEHERQSQKQRTPVGVGEAAQHILFANNRDSPLSACPTQLVTRGLAGRSCGGGALFLPALSSWVSRSETRCVAE